MHLKGNTEKTYLVLEEIVLPSAQVARWARDGTETYVQGYGASVVRGVCVCHPIYGAAVARGAFVALHSTRLKHENQLLLLPFFLFSVSVRVKFIYINILYMKALILWVIRHNLSPPRWYLYDNQQSGIVSEIVPFYNQYQYYKYENN